MEGWIDEADQRLAPLQNFILPGGSETAARLHLARTVCRRAERRVMTLTGQSPVDGTIIVYLNRLSDLLFTLARLANLEEGTGDVPWRGRTGDKPRRSG
jgi:cob(I)alamin adenosyltransferase